MNIIKKLRLKRHLTQSSLAMEVGVIPATIRTWEQGVHQPDMYNLRKLAKALKVKPAEIVDGLRDERLKTNS